MRDGSLVRTPAYQRVSFVVPVANETDDALILRERRTAAVEARVASQCRRHSQLQLTCGYCLVMRTQQNRVLAGCRASPANNAPIESPES